MKYKIFLDSVLNPEDVVQQMSDSKYANKYKEEDWIVARSYKDFVNTVTKRHVEGGVLDFMSFGYDLLDEIDKEKTSYDAAVWLVAYAVDLKQSFPNFDIHRKNVKGWEKMNNYIKNFHYEYYG